MIDATVLITSGAVSYTHLDWIQTVERTADNAVVDAIAFFLLQVVVMADEQYSVSGVCACYKINWVINSNIDFMLKQCYQVVGNINKKLWELEWTKKDLKYIFYDLYKFLPLFLY